MTVCLFVFLLAAFQTEGKLYLVLEFLRGGDLFTRLSKEVSTPANVIGVLIRIDHIKYIALPSVDVVMIESN